MIEPASYELSRRRLLGLAGTAGLAATAGVALGGLGPLTSIAGAQSGRSSATGGGTAEVANCVLTPEATEGPYYIADEAIRRDIREGRGGEVLRLVLTVVDATGCAPIEGATVEIWHADRQGNYSGFGATAANHTFLRGGQVTDATGTVRFITSYPGWYPGRCAHIHVKVHAGGNVVHTGQLYFPNRVNNQVFAESRYQHAGNRITNSQDGIFRSSGGSQTKLAITQPAGGGYKGTITMGVTR